MGDSGVPGLGAAGLGRELARLEAVRRWRLRLGPVLFIGLVALAAFMPRQGPSPGLSGQSMAVSIALLGLTVGCLGVQRTARGTGPAYLAAATAVIVSSAVLLWAQPSGPGYVGTFVGVLLVALRLPWRAALGLPAAVLVILAVVAQLAGAGAVGQVAVMAAFGGVFGMMYLADRLTDATREEERLLSEVQRRRALAAQTAGLAERQRLAREVHDVLAHSLSGLMLQLEAARIITADNAGDRRLPEIIDRAHHLARTGLDEARRAIGMLRGGELPGPERLPALTAQFQHDRGIPCHLQVSGRDRELCPQARLALYRVAQEALTNITRHAHPDRVEVRLRYEPDTTRLTVEDFAVTLADQTSPAADGDGYGLTGMRERAELLGGTLRTTTTHTGFRVELEIPG